MVLEKCPQRQYPFKRSLLEQVRKRQNSEIYSMWTKLLTLCQRHFTRHLVLFLVAQKWAFQLSSFASNWQERVKKRDFFYIPEYLICKFRFCIKTCVNRDSMIRKQTLWLKWFLRNVSFSRVCSIRRKSKTSELLSTFYRVPLINIIEMGFRLFIFLSAKKMYRVRSFQISTRRVEQSEFIEYYSNSHSQNCIFTFSSKTTFLSGFLLKL